VRSSLVVVFAVFASLILFGCAGNQKEASPTQQTPNASQPQQPPQSTAQAPKCPASCEDGNPCTTKACSVSTNYSCVYSILSNTSCGVNKVCEEGVCKEKQVENSSLGLNITQNETSLTQAKNETVVHLENESKQFIRLIDGKRRENYAGSALLTKDERLNFIAKKCNEIMLEKGMANISLCYDKYGSLTNLLSKFGFYGDNFFYASESDTQLNGGTVEQLFANLTDSEKNYLTNQSIDKLTGNNPVTYPVTMKYIGTSVDCNGLKCMQITITAGNTLVRRISFDNYWTYAFQMLPFSDDGFIPMKFSIKTLDRSASDPAWCEIIFYNNRSLVQAESNYYWSDTWGGDYKHTYNKKIDWTGYHTEDLTQPTIAYLYCYSTKGKPSGSESRDRVEVTREYVPPKRDYNNETMESIIEKMNQRPASINSTVQPLAQINEFRSRLGYSPLSTNGALETLAKSCVELSIKNKEYGFNPCLKAIFGNSSDPMYNTIASRNLFGSWEYSYNVFQDFSKTNYIDEIPNNNYNSVLGESAKDLDSFGYWRECDGDLCVSMFLLGSNKNVYNFSNVQKGYSYALMLPINKITTAAGTKIDPGFYPSVRITFNASEVGNFHIYKNKLERAEIWTAQGYPQPGWMIKETLVKSFNKTLEPGLYTVLYEPKIDKYETIGNFTMSVEYIPRFNYSN